MNQGRGKKIQSVAREAEMPDQLTDTSDKPRERHGEWDSSQRKKLNVELAISMYSASPHQFLMYI